MKVRIVVCDTATGTHDKPFDTNLPLPERLEDITISDIREAIQRQFMASDPDLTPLKIGLTEDGQTERDVLVKFGNKACFIIHWDDSPTYFGPNMFYGVVYTKFI